MKNYLLLCVLLLTGCASWNLHSICVDGVGNNLMTPCGGPVSGKVRICTVTCVGSCPKADVQKFEEISNVEVIVNGNK